MLLKKSFMLMVFVLATTVTWACPSATATNDPGLCASFKAAAQCHCSFDGHLPASWCQDMPTIYSRMLAIYRTMEQACRAQHHTTPQECIDDWNCYRYGGVNSRNELCNGTGSSCE